MSMTNANAAVLERLFNGLNRHDHETMARCYHSEAIFKDIAFELRGQKQIHAMWHMICERDIRVTFELINVDGDIGRAKVVDDYTFSSTGRRVHNVIESRFCFQNGVIIKHDDVCDARVWAAMALGDVSGFLAGRCRFLRSVKARAKLRAFIAIHPEYL
jgi:hypothetical protein